MDYAGVPQQLRGIRLMFTVSKQSPGNTSAVMFVSLNSIVNLHRVKREKVDALL